MRAYRRSRQLGPMSDAGCPFCSPPRNRLRNENGSAYWIFDGYPVARHHALVIPKRHVASFFDLSREERIDALDLIELARLEIEGVASPDGFTIGVNDKAAAGQTVAHVHIHLIPRWLGDVDDPRGGVRWVIPEKARYW
ncbi:MAG: HIT family protein [Caulobacterales bacterium]